MCLSPIFLNINSLSINSLILLISASKLFCNNIIIFNFNILYKYLINLKNKSESMLHNINKNLYYLSYINLIKIGIFIDNNNCKLNKNNGYFYNDKQVILLSSNYNIIYKYFKLNNTFSYNNQIGFEILKYIKNNINNCPTFIKQSLINSKTHIPK